MGDNPQHYSFHATNTLQRDNPDSNTKSYRKLKKLRLKTLSLNMM